MNINRLEWDSNFFGLRIGRADLVSLEEGVAIVNQRASIKEEFDLVYIFASHGLGVSFLNARLVDEKVVYVLSDTVRYEYNRKVVLWEPSKGVSDDLQHLALVSGQYSRFKLDKGLPLGSYERLYSCWIERSVNQTMASEVFCYMVEDVPRGLITLNRKGDVGTIGLVAIHEDFQHRGIGSAMMRHVIRYAQEQHCSKLSVSTQLVNVYACKLYENVGFRIESVTDVWHWWL